MSNGFIQVGVKNIQVGEKNKTTYQTPWGSCCFDSCTLQLTTALLTELEVQGTNMYFLWYLLLTQL